MAYHPMRCAIHTLQLFIKAAFQDLFEAIFFLVYTNRKFGQFMRKEFELEKDSKNINAYKSSVKLQTNCKTQKNSTLMMLKLLMRMKKLL